MTQSASNRRAAASGPQVTRREALIAAASAAVTVAVGGNTRATSDAVFVSKRPAPAKRRFVSPAVEQAIQTARAQIADPELAWLFENCYP
ncbi:MAG TPA: hypothetical protein VGJ16_08575, partial [Pirellulales bacterium]